MVKKEQGQDNYFNQQSILLTFYQPRLLVYLIFLIKFLC